MISLTTSTMRGSSATGDAEGAVAASTASAACFANRLATLSASLRVRRSCASACSTINLASATAASSERCTKSARCVASLASAQNWSAARLGFGPQVRRWRR